MAGKNIRINLNPPLALTFLIVAVTGVMLFFHIGGGVIHRLHEWLSILFLILSIVHLTLNWTMLWACLAQGPIRLSIIALVLLSAALMLAGGSNDGRGTHGQGGSGHAGYQQIPGMGK
ncbi:MAG: DUF4405 domain-containing protein [Syntrophobacter sp.]